MVVADTDRSALPESDKAFHIEQHGIDFVSEAARLERLRNDTRARRIDIASDAENRCPGAHAAMALTGSSRPRVFQ